MADEQLKELPISEDSLQGRIGDIGNCIHNLSCEHQDDDELASVLQEVRGKAWELSIDVGALERRVSAADKLVEALVLIKHLCNPDGDIKYIADAALTDYRKDSK